ncbi:MAG: ATP-binding cassette domain-containing protein, partial [Lachnospiraceae bacterium]|nr:ATP-binding cassette domain-containing protein [Lachnospiraceae bacterium]
EVDKSALRLKFPPAPRSGDYPLILDNVGKRYGNHQVFSGATFTIKRGEKVAFVGKNGEGKSTLVKCIMEEIPFDGSLKIGHNVSIGYFAQNQAQLLDTEITVFDTIDHVAAGDMRTKVRDILGAFMFGGEASDKKVKVLSGGEKTRLAMIRLLLEPMNLLILDEPTNHLDMRTKDILKEAIKAFTGTVIVVSHDREFLDGLVDKVYEFGGGKVKEHLGGIYDFLQSKKIDALSELEINKPMPKVVNPVKNAADEPKQSGLTKALSYAEQKEQQKLLKRAQKEVKDAEERIEKFEAEIKEIEAKLAAGDSSAELLEQYAAKQKAMENEISVWELAQMQLDELSN